MIGPLIVAAAVWCAAGLLTVAAPDSASGRLAIPAPWWMFVAALAAALLVPAWRRRPLLAAPALLSTLPWWPVPLPPIALLWTGPMAWLPILASVAAAVGSRPLAIAAGVPGVMDARRAPIIAAFLTLAAGGAVAWNVDARVPGGDEPHYLVITQSLLKDGDLRIENNHRQRDYAEYFGGPLAPHVIAPGRDGQIYSIHAPGLSALVLPAFALFGYRGAEIFVLLLAAATSALVWRAAWRASNDVAAAWFAWAAIAGSTTFLMHSFTLFPDGPGALIVAAAILLIVRLHRAPGEVGAGALVAVSAMLAALPWLHTRFSVLAGAIAAIVIARVLRDASRPPAARRSRVLTFALVPAVSAVAWFGFFYVIYGTPNPAAPYGGGAGTRAAYVPGGVTGLFFDQQFGLLTYAPVLLAAALALTRAAWTESRSAVYGMAGVTAAYVSAVATYWMWWAGTPASPGRFAVAILPACAVPLAVVWRDASRERRALLLALLGLSLAITAIVTGVLDGAIAWNMRDAQAAWLEWAAPVVNLPRGWPSFFWKLDPARLGTEIPFAVHVLVGAAVFAGGWMLVRRAAASRPVVAAWLLGGLMVATQAGWWLNDVPGVDAARSQAQVLGASGPLLEISPLRVGRRGDAAGAMVIRAEEPPRLEGPRPWLALGAVPAGTYTVRINVPRSKAGQLSVRAGRSGQAIASLAVQPLTRQTAALSLPIGVTRLALVPDAELEGRPAVVELEPVRLEPSRQFARLVASYGPARVHFFDDHVDAEPAGFWIRGATTAAFAIDAAEAAPAALTLRNGPGDNEVALEIGGVPRRERLGPSETRRVDLPVSGRPVYVRISPASGFRPSDDGTSTDNRYLGVFVEIEN